MSRPSKYTRELLEPIVKDSKSLSEVIEKLNLIGIKTSKDSIRNYIKKFALITIHFISQHIIRVSDEKLIDVVKNSKSIREISIKIYGKLTGQACLLISNKIKALNLDISHFVYKKNLKITKELLENAVKQSKSISEIIRIIRPNNKSSSFATSLKKLIKSLNISISHFPNQNGAWNKGLTKETDDRIKNSAIKFIAHIKKYGHNFKGLKHKPETKLKLSIAMKKDHAEGRAHNIGQSRWNNEPSYPEIFFKKIIDNEFLDKDVKQEFPAGIYSIDFAWTHKMKAIEIDGGQHDRFPEYIERDKRKDKFLIENGWDLLRIKWKDMVNNTKEWIEIAKNFIDNGEYIELIKRANLIPKKLTEKQINQIHLKENNMKVLNKVDWSKVNLQELKTQYSNVEIGKLLGVSESAVRRRLKKINFR